MRRLSTTPRLTRVYVSSKSDLNSPSYVDFSAGSGVDWDQVPKQGRGHSGTRAWILVWPVRHAQTQHDPQAHSCLRLIEIGPKLAELCRFSSATTLRLVSLSPRGILQWPEEQSRSGCGQDGGNADQSQHRRMWRCRSSCPLILARPSPPCQPSCSQPPPPPRRSLV